MTITWQGLDSFLGSFQRLSQEWKRETAADAARAAATTASQTRAVYQAHRRTGALAGSLRVTSIAPLGSLVEATAAHAGYFEHGTRRSRATPTLIPNAIAARRAFEASCEARVRADRLLI